MRRRVIPNLLVFALCTTTNVLGSSSTPRSCNLSPVEFLGQEFPNAIKYFVGDDGTMVSNGVKIDKAVFTFGPLHSVPNTEHQVVDMSVRMDFDTQSVVNDWISQVNAQADEGCSSRKVWFPNPAWDIDQTGAWMGRFHVKQVTRKCYWLFGDQQTEMSVNEVDFWNKVTVSAAPDGRKLVSSATNGESDNTPDFVKVIARGLGAIAQVVTLGFVPQANVQAIDGNQEIEKAMAKMDQYERGMLKNTNAAGPKVIAGFQVDFLFTKASFRKEGNRPIISVESSQTQDNLPNEGEACTIREGLIEMKTGGNNVGPAGTSYTTIPGDSLWNIANANYGNGKYFMVIAAANNIAFGNMNHIPVAKHLRLDSIANLRNRQDFVMVMKGDSLWTLSAQNGSHSFAGLVQANLRWVEDEDKIYPLQMVQVPSREKTTPKASR
jgi:hypothetical protein